MRTQQLLGRAQARQGRISRKAKRTRVRASLSIIGDTVTVNSRSQHADRRNVRREYVGREYAEQVRANAGVATEGWIRPVSIGYVREFVPVRLFDEVPEYFGPRTQLVLRLRRDTLGRNGYARKCLQQTAARQEFRFRSIHGPTAIEDDERGTVEIKLRDDEYDEGLARVLIVAGWRQCRSDARRFVAKLTKESRHYAADFCWMHAGDWFTVSGCSSRALELIRHGTNWSYPIEERTVVLPGNGTNEHARTFHPVRKPRSKAAKVKPLRRTFADSMRSPGGFIPGESFGSTARHYNIDGQSLYIG